MCVQLEACDRCLVDDCSQRNGRVADQRLANVDGMWYGQRWIRFLRSSSLSCGASGRGGVLESELIGDATGKLNIIHVVTTDDILIPQYVFSLAYLTLVTADCGWDTVVLVRAHSLAFLLVLLSFVLLEPQERILEHCWYTGDAAGKTDVEKGVSEQQLNRISGLSRKLECFGHAVVEPCCCGVSRALWRAEHCLPFSCE